MVEHNHYVMIEKLKEDSPELAEPLCENRQSPSTSSTQEIEISIEIPRIRTIDEPDLLSCFPPPNSQPVDLEDGVYLLPPKVVLSEKMQKALEEIDTEADDGAEACCRICLESDDSDDSLISPCQCKGTQQYVHRSCLDHWRAVKEGFAFAHCTTCKAQYHLRPNLPEDFSWRKRKFQLFVTRDLCLVFLGVQLVIVLMALLVALLDWKLVLSKSSEWALAHPLLFYYCSGLFVFLVLFGIGGMFFHCSYGSQIDLGPCGGACAGNCGSELAMGVGCGELLIVAVVVFAFLGAVYGVMAAMLAWQRIWQRHYHILAKKVLAEEYIVVDLHGEYVTPKLSAIDEERLKSLGFL